MLPLKLLALRHSLRYLCTMPPSGSIFSYKPRPLVLCGPSGSGKSTLVKQLLSEFNEYFGFSVSHTTRKPRPGEVDGREYHFTDRETMLREIENSEFLEHAEFSGNMYGTSKKAVRTVQGTGKICILDIDTQGVKLIKKTDLNPHYVFISPPSLQVLEERLRSRNTETEESLNRRLSAAKNELDYGEQPGNFDKIIVNDDLGKAYEELRQFILPEIRQLVSQ